MVILTRFVADDAAIMCAADADPELRLRFEFPADFVPSLEHSAQVLRRWNEEWAAGRRFPFAVRDTTTHELLGGCELRPVAPGVANVSYWTYPAHRRRGIATHALRALCRRAFDDFGFQTLKALIDADNVPSQRVAAAAGFERAGARDERLLFVRRSP